MTSKYHNVPVYIDGIRFMSRKEGQDYLNFKAMKKAGEIKELKLQPKFKFDKTGITYVADFDVTWKDGKREIFDSKGYKTAIYKIKKKLFKYFYPDLTLEEI